jgi:hypothetical protein
MKWLALTCALTVLIGALLASPLALEPLGRLLVADADYASKIGSSFGAISALISAVALLLLAVASFLQYRQTQIAQLQAARTMQLELLKISLENPAYRLALGTALGDKSPGEWRSHAYRNLWFMHFQMSYITGAVTEKGLRAWLEREFFADEHGLKFWECIKAAAAAEASSRAHRVFNSMVDDECKRARKRLHAVPEQVQRPSEPGSSHLQSNRGGVVRDDFSR